MVKLVATDLAVYVGSVRVGHVMNLGDCWRAWLYGRRRRKRFQDFDSRKQAVAAVVLDTRRFVPHVSRPSARRLSQ